MSFDGFCSVLIVCILIWNIWKTSPWYHPDGPDTPAE